MKDSTKLMLLASDVEQITVPRVAPEMQPVADKVEKILGEAAESIRIVVSVHSPANH